MGKSFWTHISNGKHSIGSTGGMVYVYDEKDIEIAKFKDMNYAYDLTFFPDGERFVARSNEGLIAVYDLRNLRLIKKFRYGKAKDPHDGNLCISADGKYIYVVVYTFDEKKNAPNCWIDVYETETFSLVETLFKESEIYPYYIEWGEEKDVFYLLGSAKRGRSVIARCKDGYADVLSVSENTERRYHNIKCWQLSGFTPKQREWIYPKDEVLERLDTPLAELWKIANLK